ncbi:hypothetical protein HOLleu_17638 [Holothuria leucospilota]|uniref:C-type lectin domain-containing protein n=1 Tax=Holothuria leucospilota TaxID=206669 RepID=A0A9Q1H8Z8_HOLLE|nr:hypothetical protein HOLleu_17638 [Holothuria leucospilota]
MKGGGICIDVRLRIPSGYGHALFAFSFVCGNKSQCFVQSVAACFDYNGGCLREDTVTTEHKHAKALCTSNGGNLLSVNSDEKDYKDRQAVLLSNFVNFPFWLDCHYSGGAWRSGGMIFNGSGNPNNTGVWRWTEDPDKEDEGSCVTLLSSGEIALTDCETQHTVICASNWPTIVDNSTTPPSTSSITTIATTLEAQTTSHPESTTTMFITTDVTTEDTTKSISPTTINFTTISDETTQTTMMMTANTRTDQTRNLHETSKVTTEMTSSYQTTGKSVQLNVKITSKMYSVLPKSSKMSSVKMNVDVIHVEEHG